MKSKDNKKIGKYVTRENELLFGEARPASQKIVKKKKEEIDVGASRGTLGVRRMKSMGLYFSCAKLPEFCAAR